MKKVIVVAIIAAVFAGCSKEDDGGTGTVELTVSYFYNDYQGYKPDVGAQVHVFDEKYGSVVCYDSMSIVAARIGIIYDKQGEPHVDEIYSTEVGAGGVAKFALDAGNYFMIVASEGRWLYSTKSIKVNKDEVLYLTKNFGYRNEFQGKPESW
jgi:hypothetical protein